MVENSRLHIKGSAFKSKIGEFFLIISNYFSEQGNKIMQKNKDKIVSNPSAKLFNPFTVVINFTVDNNEKYQILLQGDYKQKYKESEDGTFNLTEVELFDFIESYRDKWFKKE